MGLFLILKLNAHDVGIMLIFALFDGLENLEMTLS